jgi:tRNA A-37 threonylcarbamoyl transferase component Bud32
MSEIDHLSSFTGNSRRFTLNYRSVPSWLVNIAIAASVTFAGLGLFQSLAPGDQMIAPPEFNRSAISRSSRAGRSLTLMMANLSNWVAARTNLASPSELFQRRSEYLYRRTIAGRGLDSLSPAGGNFWHRLISPEVLESLRQEQSTVPLILLLFSAISALLAIKLAERKLTMDSRGIKFPTGMLPDLDLRGRRKWQDVAALAMSVKKNEEAAESINVYFKSGGRASLQTARLSLKDLEQLFAAIEQFAPQVKPAPELLTFRHRIFNVPTAPSFTNLWEEELHSHFASTNFVALSPAATLQNGKIKIAMHLYSGGLSAVYLAEKDNKLVVVKESVVPQGTNAEARRKAKELFAREAGLLIKLNHAKIARVLDYFQENDRDYLLLEYIPGTTLKEYVRRHGPQPEERVAAWSICVAEILKYLHDEDPPVIHRDLTPDNLMLTPEGDIVLIDFGAANQFLGSATGTVVGKQFYISPEQFRGKAVPASDIYSLGGTMYYLLTGQEPEALSTAHPRQVAPGVTPDLDSIVARCTALTPPGRYESAAELIDDLARLSKSPAPAGKESASNLDSPTPVCTRQKEIVCR